MGIEASASAAHFFAVVSNREATAIVRDRPILCLAASGGGHVRQILDLEPLWRDFPRFFVTEDTALGRSIAAGADTEFVPHFALGQARLGSPLRMLGAAWRSLWRSLSIIRRRRPDVVLTTGAGSLLFIVLWARLRGARIVLIDSFARFEAPSAFARLAGPLAHLRIAQAANSAQRWPGARVFDPLRMLDTPAPPKEPLLFATVGATLPFPRLVATVLAAKAAGRIEEKVILQVGTGAAAGLGTHDGVEIVEELAFDEVQALLRRARWVVCHGGTGSIITALREHCRVVAIPRRFALAEHYDEHQEEITRAFEQRGLLRIAHDQQSLANAMDDLRSAPPRAATTDPAPLIAYLAKWIGDVRPHLA